ncbi:Hypothetical predicted protein [Cloeon dipterum]|uniref:F-box/LRR-repeat protein 15/At3g58940/PEG3-like LRR domain-containing protein n=1 Tax=Cloeon dipterum TaxID=197152 RepID=A0A8S1E1D9_9INSE|nr:Hypothetical predicted protein [Cloeon dipterum]
MEDETLLRKTKLRLQQKKTAKNWAMKAVLSNMDAYTQEENANFIQSKLSPQMRDDVLQEMLNSRILKKFNTIEEFKGMMRSAFALMTTRTYNLDLYVLMSCHPRPNNDPSSVNDFIEILKMISISAPNVRHMQMRSFDLGRCLANNEVRKECIGYLASLKNLRILEVIGSVSKNAILPQLCRELPNLRVLSAPEIPLLDTCMTEEEIRESFGHLRLLHIESVSSDKKLKMWTVLPHLDIIQSDKKTSFELEDFLEDENIPRALKYLNFEDQKLNESADLSSIKYLEFSCDEKKWEELKKLLNHLTTLEGLTLKIMNNSAPVDDVLLHCGANLRWLTLIGNGLQSVELNCISQLCPRLKVLGVTSVQVTAKTSQQANFRHLEELFTEGLELWTDGSLTAVLSSSPNLRKMDLLGEASSLDELQQIKNSITEKKILGSLQSLHWHMGKTTSRLDFIKTSSVLKNASANLPNLRKMKLTFEKGFKSRSDRGWRDWATKSVLSNLDAYTQEGSANHLKIKLSPELRNYVLQELLVIGNSKICKNMDDFNSLKRSVFALMNNRTYKLDLNILVSSYPSNMNSELVFTEVLRLVSIAAPNVRHLKINTHHITVCSNHIEYRNKSLEYLSSLKELMILEFVGYIHNSMDLVLWCRNLPNLRVLCANGTLLEDTNLTLEDIRLSFGHLSLLHIPFLSSKEIKKIWKVLPNLDILTEQILPNGLTLEDFLGDENFPRERKYLSCEALIYGLNFWADFSSIKYMEFYCCERRWNDFERNHNLPTAIDGLILFMLNSQETVEAVLLKYGANLRWLSLRGLSYQNVDLNHISELCPNLEVLSMTSVRVMGNATKQTYFSHLKELFIERVYMINGSLTAVLSSSPNLRKLKLNVRTCCLDDLQQVKNLIVEKKILEYE